MYTFCRPMGTALKKNALNYDNNIAVTNILTLNMYLTDW